MTDKPENPQAYPWNQQQNNDGTWDQNGHMGMTLRDYFAGQALAGILGGGFADTIPHDDVNGGSDAAFFAYSYADAMLKERGKTND